RIEQTLRSGHDVYVVGLAPRTRPASTPPDLLPAPQTAFRWKVSSYITNWASQVAYAVQTQALCGMIISVPCSQPISNAENVHAFVVTGWKQSTVALRQ